MMLKLDQNGVDPGFSLNTRFIAKRYVPYAAMRPVLEHRDPHRWRWLIRLKMHGRRQFVLTVY